MSADLPGAETTASAATDPIGELVSALAAHPDVAEHQPVSLSLLLTWPRTGEGTNAAVGMDARLAAHRYAAGGDAARLPATAALAAAAAHCAETAVANRPLVHGQPDEPAGVVVKVTASHNEVTILSADAADLWRTATDNDVADLLRPDAQTAVSGPELDRRLLDHAVETALSSAHVEGLLLEGVSIVARRHHDDSVDVRAVAHAAGSGHTVWTLDPDTRDILAEVFTQAADTTAAMDGDLPRVIVVSVDVHESSATVSLLHGPASDAWFTTETGQLLPDSGPVLDARLVELTHTLPAPEASAAPAPTEPVYEAGGGRMWLRPDVIAALLVSLFAAAEQPDRAAAALSLVALPGPNGIEARAFLYPPLGRPEPVSCADPRIAATISAAFEQNPRLDGLLVGVDLLADRVGAALIYPPDSTVWNRARTNPEHLAAMARPLTADQLAALAVLAAHPEAPDHRPGDGALVLPLSVPGSWLVQTYDEWSIDASSGWVVAGASAAHVSDDEDPDAIAHQLPS